MTKRSNPRAEQLRAALAQEAARIMSEQGIDDYGLAKRKAAERFGATDIAVLPKNTEIEAALAAHHRLFEAHTHSSTLSALRRTALQAMRLLQRFEPRLVGPVLSGTASAHSEVNLHLFAEGAEPVALHLMERGIPQSMFTVMFAIARTVGWVAHWQEMISDPAMKIGRPRQLYTGPGKRDYIEMNKR
jgi:hypothetical protein